MHPTVCSALSTWAHSCPWETQSSTTEQRVCKMLDHSQPLGHPGSPSLPRAGRASPRPWRGCYETWRQGEGSWPRSGPWVLLEAYKTFTFGLSPPEASFSFSGCELSAIKLRSDGTTRPALYPDDPAPRGLDGQEFAALRTREGCPHQSTVGHTAHYASITGSEFREHTAEENISLSCGKTNPWGSQSPRDLWNLGTCFPMCHLTQS